MSPARSTTTSRPAAAKGSQLSKEALRGVGIKVALNVCRHVVIGEIDCAGKQFRAPVAIGEDCTRRFGLVGDIDSTKRQVDHRSPPV
jgi:hypothetical protein